MYLFNYLFIYSFIYYIYMLRTHIATTVKQISISFGVNSSVARNCPWYCICLVFACDISSLFFVAPLSSSNCWWTYQHFDLQTSSSWNKLLCSASADVSQFLVDGVSPIQVCIELWNALGKWSRFSWWWVPYQLLILWIYWRIHLPQ
jgi:hypothetical protein